MSTNDVALTHGVPPEPQDPNDREEVNRRFQSELGMVEIVASQISRSIDNCIDFDELLAAGHEGLFEAARRFDPKRGASFRTFASYRVEGAILDYIRQLLKLPRHAEERLTALAAMGQICQGEHSLETRDSATWRCSKSPADFIDDEVAAMATAAALSVERLAVGISASASGNPEEAYEQAELLAIVKAAISELSEAEAEAIRLYYFEEKSHAATAEAMNLTKPWVHRIHVRAVSTLSKRLRNAGYT